MTRHEIEKLKRAERDAVFDFLITRVVDTVDGKPLHTKVLYAAYQAWRKKQGLQKTMYSLKGFGKVIPYKRVIVWDGPNETVAHAIPGKRLA